MELGERVEYVELPMGPLGTNPLLVYRVEVEVIQSSAVITSISSFR